MTAALLAKTAWIPRIRHAAGRIWLRLLLVNVVVVLVPVAGLEFARIYERQLLHALERDMNDQGALTRSMLEEDLRQGVQPGDPRHARILEDAARRTRMRVRILNAHGTVVTDSHGEGPPEGAEPSPPRLFGSRGGDYEERSLDSRRGASSWPDIAERREVKAALSGSDAAQTRVAHRPKAVFLFSATPIFRQTVTGRVVEGAVYVTRSTRPVLLELYRIRSGLIQVLAVALALSVSVTLLLAFSISRPLARLSKAARRIATGERGVPVPVGGSGEIRELSESFKTMTEELDARLAYISEFSADVAHEFKSPLTAIRGAAELLSEGAHEDPEARERFLKNILLDTERLDRLVSRLLVLSRIESSASEMALVDLRALLDRLVRRAADRGPVVLSYEARHHFILARQSDIETAVLNLLDNAQRYAPAGAPVVVTVTDSEGGLVVAVFDSGPGIPEGRRRKVFERFYTTDAERGGTGLGLSIVDSVARAHGGRVTLDPAPGVGSRFVLWLPRPGARQGRQLA